MNPAQLRAAIEGLPVHYISGYEWECSECHYHFAERDCHIHGPQHKDEEVDSLGNPSGHDQLIDRGLVLALLEREGSTVNEQIDVTG